MTDDYNLAKPDPTAFSEMGSDDYNPFLKDPQPYRIDVNLPEGDVVMGDPAHMQREDKSGFVAGQDRMLSAPELLAENRKLRADLADLFRKAAKPIDGPPAILVEENKRLRAQVEKLTEAVQTAVAPIGPDTSDGYHTFRELYDHRRALTAALASALVESSGRTSCWRSRKHHPLDSACYEGYFIVGIETPMGPITYHYADQYWDDFQKVPELPHSPRWDGAGPELTVTRLIDAARG